jgi:hypothetical protein
VLHCILFLGKLEYSILVPLQHDLLRFFLAVSLFSGGTAPEAQRLASTAENPTKLPDRFATGRVQQSSSSFQPATASTTSQKREGYEPLASGDP